MQNTLKMPTYDELVSLSNGELTRRTRLALAQLVSYDQACSGLAEAEKIYYTYHRERQKRLLVARKLLRSYS